MSGTSSSIKTKLWWNSHWMVLFQNGVRQLRSPDRMATTVQLRCYWKQLWSRWAITGSWEPLVNWLESFWNYVNKFHLSFTISEINDRKGAKKFKTPKHSYYSSNLKFCKMFICMDYGLTIKSDFEIWDFGIVILI